MTVVHRFLIFIMDSLKIAIMQFFSQTKPLLILSIVSVCCQVSSYQQQAHVVEQKLRHKVIVPNLPPDHYQFWLRNHPRAREEFEKICSQVQDPFELKFDEFNSLHAYLYFEDSQYSTNLNYGKNVLAKICSKISVIGKSCWGYENNCEIIHLMPECRNADPKKEQQQKVAWFNQADFGYILERRKELSKFCSPEKHSNHSVKSSLECTKYFRTCRGDHIMMRFHDIPKNLLDSNQADLIKAGDIGGWNCDLQLKRIPEEGGQNGSLQSWFNELKNYNLIKDSSKEFCEVTIEKPAFIIKLDDPKNIYHYICNFLNLYATFHLHNRFSDDIEIIIWDSRVPRSMVDMMWKAFARNRIRSIGEFEGKRVCFKKFIFTLLPRMEEGLYYNTSLVQGCSKTGLFSAFNRHVLHRLNVTQVYSHREAERKKLRITILRRNQQFRRISNDDQLENSIKIRYKDHDVEIIALESIRFSIQITKAQNSDILVGIHGAGLTNLLFLPDWAAVIELHDCNDKSYYDLSRLRGLSYFKPREQDNLLRKLPITNDDDMRFLNKSNIAGYEKFSNYEIQDIDQFFAVFDQAVERVLQDREIYFQNLEDRLAEERKNLGQKKLKIENKNSHEEL